MRTREYSCGRCGLWRLYGNSEVIKEAALSAAVVSQYANFSNQQLLEIIERNERRLDNREFTLNRNDMNPTCYFTDFDN